MSLKILALPAYFRPENISSGHLDQNLHQAFTDAGIELVVYTPRPTRGISAEVYREYKNRKEEKLYGGRMTIHRFGLMREGTHPLARAFRYTLSCIRQFNRGVFARDARTCNLLFVASTPPIQGAMAALVKKFRRIPMIYNLQDIFPDSLTGSGLAHKGGLLWKAGRMIENFTYRNADKIIVISEGFKQNILSKGVPEEKIEVIYNWVDERVVSPVAKADNPLFEELGLSREKFLVVYAGNLGSAQNIGILLEAAEKLRHNPKIEFLIFGKGGSEDRLRTHIREKGLDNVRLLPLLPSERVSQVYSLGDVCIVTCKAGLGGSAMPSKTWSILSAARPVLVNFDEGELKSIIESARCGVFTQAGDADAFAAAIEDLSQSPEKCRLLGQNGRQFILDNLTREISTRKYVEVIRQTALEKGIR